MRRPTQEEIALAIKAVRERRKLADLEAQEKIMKDADGTVFVSPQHIADISARKERK